MATTMASTDYVKRTDDEIIKKIGELSKRIEALEKQVMENKLYDNNRKKK